MSSILMTLIMRLQYSNKYPARERYMLQNISAPLSPQIRYRSASTWPFFSAILCGVTPSFVGMLRSAPNSASNRRTCARALLILCYPNSGNCMSHLWFPMNQWYYWIITNFQTNSRTWGICTRRAGKTLQCSFSSVSTPPIARVGAFFFAFFAIYKIFTPSHRSESKISAKNLLKCLHILT